MMKQKGCLSFWFLFSLAMVSTCEAQKQESNVKLFVFGDSYADTGNNPLAWVEPFGITFPGKPFGRASDGRVITDYIASFFSIITPLSFQSKDTTNKTQLQYGMNFAYGGSGVFPEVQHNNSMTLQIDRFQQLLEEKVFSNVDNSVALICYTGNDYAYYFMSHNRSTQGVETEVPRIVNQLVINMKRIQGLGVKRTAITLTPPRGCWPMVARPPYKQCDDASNKPQELHNQLLLQAMEKLNEENKDSKIVILDLHSAFVTAIANQTSRKEIPEEYKNALKPCCGSADGMSFCGDVDQSGKKLYEVCDHPEFSFFWDSAHPSQSGWETLFPLMEASLDPLL